MLPKLKISEYLLKRLERVKLQCSGCLYGVFYGNGTLLLLNFNVESTIGQLNYEQIQHKLPAELDLCGLVKFGECTDTEAHLGEVFSSVDITDNPILLQCNLGSIVGLRSSFYIHGKLQEVAYEVMDAAQLYNDFCFTRLKCGLYLRTAQTVEAIKHEMHVLRKRVADGNLVFNVNQSDIFFNSYGMQCKDFTSDSLMEDLIRAIPLPAAPLTNSQSGGDKKSKSGNAAAIKTPELYKYFGAVGSDYDIINIDVLRVQTREPPAPNSPSHSALNICLTKAESKVEVPLELDAMAILCKKTKLNRLYEVLIESICRALRLYEQCLVEQLEVDSSAAEGSGKVRVPRGHHFLPQEFGHFLTLAYPAKLSDDEPSMQEQRKRHHKLFGLPVTRPYFRRANQCPFIGEQDPSVWTPLLNTHIGVRPSGVQDGKQYLVNGNYYYYHYLQQQIQDNGWGCAYRSLQTICSWFVLQGYTTGGGVPMHREIQEYLHKIKDKPSSFVGSSQWIGSTELAMCLQGFLNVDSKILHVSSGAELSTTASELAMHFQTQGTPVMIGGGVLAHTIIGIDYCLSSGHMKFLILDPHYTGADDLVTIQSKGWCGWKGVDFWDKKSYYNLCMPQRPILY